jgi:hypothetical protein
MSPCVAVRLLVVIIVGGVLALAATAKPAHAFVTDPTAPYRTVTDQEFWQIVQNFDGTAQPQAGGMAPRVESGVVELERIGRFLPKLQLLGRVSLGATAFTAGWKIGRLVDTKWLHLSGDVGVKGAADPVDTADWYWSDGPIYCSYGGPCLSKVWLMKVSASGRWPNSAAITSCNYLSCAGWDANQLAWDRAAWAYEGPDGPLQLGHLIGIPDQYCGQDCSVRYFTESEMEAVMHVDRIEAYSSQAFDYSTTYTIPGDAGNSTDTECARERIEGSVSASCTTNDPNGYPADSNEPGTTLGPAGDEINHEGAGGNNPAFPSPIPLLWPAPGTAETYAQYLLRLRDAGWMGTATVITLLEQQGDPSYVLAGVPCTSVSPGTAISQTTSVTFFKNPDSASGPLGGGSSGSWDCSAGAATPASGDCEYDAAVGLDWLWEKSDPTRTSGLDDACTAAWNQFLSGGGTSDSPDRTVITGAQLRNTAVISHLEGIHSPITDWDKVEWGPFYLSNGTAFVVHAYRLSTTGLVDTAMDYKVKFKVQIP